MTELTPNYSFYKPSEGESGCASQLNNNLQSIDALIKAIADALAGKAEANHNHNAYALAQEVATALAGKAEANHNHTLGQITNLSSIFGSVAGITPDCVLSGSGNERPTVTIWCVIPSTAALIEWTVQYKWGNTSFVTVESFDKRIVIEKPDNDSDVWVNGKTSISLKISAKNRFNGEVSDVLERTYPAISAYNMITIAQIISALKQDTVFIGDIAGEVAQKTVAEVWAIQQAK